MGKRNRSGGWKKYPAFNPWTTPGARPHDLERAADAILARSSQKPHHHNRKPNRMPTEEQITELRRCGCRWNPPNFKAAQNTINQIHNSKKYKKLHSAPSRPQDRYSALSGIATDDANHLRSLGEAAIALRAANGTPREAHQEPRAWSHSIREPASPPDGSPDNMPARVNGDDPIGTTLEQQPQKSMKSQVTGDTQVGPHRKWMQSLGV